MKPLKIEFVPLRDRKADVLRVVAILMALAVAAAMALLGFTYASLRAVQAETETLQNRLMALTTERDATRRVRSYDVAARVALKAAEFPLEAALAALEDAATLGVQLTSLEVDLLQGTAKAQVEALAALELEKYLRRLGSVAESGGWQVVRIGAGPNASFGVTPLPPDASGPLSAGMLGAVGATKTAVVPPVSGGVTAELGWVGPSRSK